jgi:hypothetical protein
MSVNLSLAQYMWVDIQTITHDRSCLELITYTPHPSSSGPNAMSTLFQQRATMLSGFPTRMVANRIEKASVERFGANAGVGKKGFEWVLTGGQSGESRGL